MAPQIFFGCRNEGEAAGAGGCGGTRQGNQGGKGPSTRSISKERDVKELEKKRDTTHKGAARRSVGIANCK